MAIAPGMVVEAAWRISADDGLFGGYSALHADMRGDLLAISDQGAWLRFRDPSLGDPAPRMGWLVQPRPAHKYLRDSEAITADPATGALWLAYENRNAIARYDAKARREVAVTPPAMRRWPRNGGPEAIARLPDGRFIVLRENTDAAGPGGLLFPGDPVGGSEPLPFRFRPPAGYQPADMAVLPDGRVVVLVRKLAWPFPPVFGVRLLLADPAAIRGGEYWPWDALAELESPLPMDNYEGIAIVPRRDGAVTLWIISDDNRMMMQQTYLLKIRWDVPNGHKKAREEPRAPS